MDKDSKYYIRTGEHPMIDEWVNNNWPDGAKEAIVTCIPDYQDVMRLRTSTSGPKVSAWGDRVQIVLNYNHDKDCFIVWNAAIQRSIHRSSKPDSIILSFGADLEAQLRQPIESDSVSYVYQEIRDSAPKLVELVLVVGQNALSRFLRNYSEMLKPDPKQIKKGKSCVYAVAGGEIEYIHSER